MSGKDVVARYFEALDAGDADAIPELFSDEQAVYNARVGDVVKEQFVLVNIGYESVDIGFVNFPDAASRRLAVGGP